MGTSVTATCRPVLGLGSERSGVPAPACAAVGTPPCCSLGVTPRCGPVPARTPAPSRAPLPARSSRGLTLLVSPPASVGENAKLISAHLAPTSATRVTDRRVMDRWVTDRRVMDRRVTDRWVTDRRGFVGPAASLPHAPEGLPLRGDGRGHAEAQESCPQPTGSARSRPAVWTPRAAEPGRRRARACFL